MDFLGVTMPSNWEDTAAILMRTRFGIFGILGVVGMWISTLALAGVTGYYLSAYIGH